MITGGRATTVDTAELAALAGRMRRAAALVQDAIAATRAVGTLVYYVPPVPAVFALTEQLRAVVHSGLSMVQLADRAGSLAADLQVQQQWYEEADARAYRGFDPPWWRYGAHLLGPPKVRGAVTALDVAAVVGHGAVAHSRLGNPRLLDAVVAQEHVRALAGRLQWSRPESVMGGMFLGRLWVDVRERTPVERTALGLVPMLENVSLVAHAGRDLDGVSVAQVPPLHLLGGLPGHGGAWVTAPTVLPGGSVTAPLAAAGPAVGATAVMGAAVVATRIGRPVRRPPGTPAQTLARIGALEEQAHAANAGAVEVLRTTAPDGRRHWTVVVPGTQEQLGGGRNPMDNDTNLRTMAGVVSDMEIGVATAMDQAGIAPGEPVAMAVHSQGGLVAARLVADPVFTARFDVQTVLTAGSPIAAVELPPSVAVLSLEDVNDPTVGLDGYPNEPAANHVTVAVHSGEPARVGAPHLLPSYVRAAQRLDDIDDAGVQDWLGRNRAAMGTGVPGARTESLLFEIVRTR
ncbi:hypothetical protein [Georgenia yuyongxinii]|uniref:Alpha/beta hydrolase n=1 Tax=Georgenia yuyongxinii TaxID=2589797 RepID=A0A552WW70_9MICO|nr:hypothetical protein [Georgenia yuyongxinii]TRW46936.1 hypothetical protein FJ693_02835 [Georgenia yuyongxinii]